MRGRLAMLALLWLGAQAAGPAPALAEAGRGGTHDTGADFPVVLENCGVRVVFERPPERVVAIKSSVFELLLALGLGDRIVGIGFPDGPLPPELAVALADPDGAARAAVPGAGGSVEGTAQPAGRGISGRAAGASAAGVGDGSAPVGVDPGTLLPLLSDRVPAQEVVLGTAPDLVLAGWESVLTPTGAGSRESYAALGIATWVAPVACRSGPGRPARLTFDSVFEQIREVGLIFGVTDRAQALVAAQRALLEAVTSAAGGAEAQGVGAGAVGSRPAGAGMRSALWYSSGTQTPFVGAGLGGPQMMLEALGLANIMADLPDTWASASWEAIAARDPDIIVLVDALWNPVAQKRRLLAEGPVTGLMPAVAGERYLTIDFAAAEPGVRSVPALLELAAQLRALDTGE